MNSNSRTKATESNSALMAFPLLIGTWNQTASTFHQETENIPWEVEDGIQRQVFQEPRPDNGALHK